MTINQEAFEEYKDKMKDKWKEEIPSASLLIQKTSEFYQIHIQEYLTNSLFLELLDFQIYIIENFKDDEFKIFFKKENQDVDLEYFPFIFPVYEHSNIIRSHLTPDAKNSQFSNFYFSKSLIKFQENTETKANLLNFLKQNPVFDYYFWNVTFPNLFLGFISDDYCQKAVEFINGFESDLDVFLKGVKSLIIHNYYFQDAFMKSFFVNSQSENNIEKYIQESLKQSVQKLNINQLNILIKLIENHPKEAREMFLYDIIIRCIKLWKYSPLYSTSQINKDQKDKIDIIELLKKKFIDDENHDTKLDEFLKPVFESIKSRITINNIQLNRLIFNLNYKVVATFFDVLLIAKFTNGQPSTHYSALLKKFNNRFLLKKAFCYFYYGANYGCPEDMDTEVKRPPFNQAAMSKWNQIKLEASQHNKNPLEVFYDDKKLSKLMNQDPELAYVGIASSYYNWLEYSETKKVLKKESHTLITIKAITESQQNIIEIITNKFSLLHPIHHKTFIEDMKNIYKTNVKNIMLKFLTTSFKSYNPIKYNREQLKLALNDVSSNIENELSNNFDSYFNSNHGITKIYEFFTNQRIIFRTKYLGLSGKIDPDQFDLVFFKQFYRFMGYFSKAYLINSYNDVKSKLVQISDKIEIPSLEKLSIDSFAHFASSGIFKYIVDFVNNAKSVDSDKSEMVYIGQVFAAVPVINKFFRQFIDNQYTSLLLTLNEIQDESELIMLILGYAFKFHDKNSDPKEKITDFFEILATAYEELSLLDNALPYFAELNEEFLFLNKFIPYISINAD